MNIQAKCLCKKQNMSINYFFWIIIEGWIFVTTGVWLTQYTYAVKLEVIEMHRWVLIQILNAPTPFNQDRDNFWLPK